MSTIKYMQLEEELKNYSSVLSKFVDAVLEEKISKYPIIVAHQDQLQVGLPIIKTPTILGNWLINGSTLEEFYQKHLIHEAKIEAFRSAYKSPSEYFCIFVLSELGADFIFLRR